MTGLVSSRTLHVAIACDPQTVYNYVVNPEHLSEWAPSFCLAVRKSEADWLIDTPEGSMKIRFVERNDYGVLDHEVRMNSGQVVLNPMRVIPNGSGSEVLFTVYHYPGLSEDQFKSDYTNVERDLRTLKRVLEDQ